MLTLGYVIVSNLRQKKVMMHPYQENNILVQVVTAGIRI